MDSLLGTRVKLHVIDHSYALRDQERRRAPQIRFSILQQPDHTVPRSVLVSVSPAVGRANSDAVDGGFDG